MRLQSDNVSTIQTIQDARPFHFFSFFFHGFTSQKKLDPSIPHPSTGVGVRSTMNEVLVNLTDEARWWMLVGIVMGALLYVSWRQDVDGKRFDPKPRMLIDPHLDKGELSQYHIDLVVKRKVRQ